MKNLLIIITLLMTHSLLGQTLTTHNGTPINQRYGFGLGYYGFKFNNPGFQISAENYLSSTRNFQTVAGLHLQFHHEKDQQTAIALNVRIGQRYITNFGLLLESHFGIGVQQTTFISKIFDLTTTPVTETKVKTAKTGVIPNIALGIGYDFSKTTNLPITFYFRPNITWLYPDKNLVFNTTMNIETGIIYKPTFRQGIDKSPTH